MVELDPDGVECGVRAQAQRRERHLRAGEVVRCARGVERRSWFVRQRTGWERGRERERDRETRERRVRREGRERTEGVEREDEREEREDMDDRSVVCKRRETKRAAPWRERAMREKRGGGGGGESERRERYGERGREKRALSYER